MVGKLGRGNFYSSSQRKKVMAVRDQASLDSFSQAERKRQHEVINTILYLVRHFEEELGHAERGELEKFAKANGVSEYEFMVNLEKLKKDGNIYEPKKGWFKLV